MRVESARVLSILLMVFVVPACAPEAKESAATESRPTEAAAPGQTEPPAGKPAVYRQTTPKPPTGDVGAPPNILIIWGDDVGMWNISAYHRGMMGGSTPNIDRIANEGILFMDHYAQASCTAGRAAFITGQYPIRTGLSTVGLPGSPIGLHREDPTLAEFLKPMGYATGQFGKNHLGDLDEHLPTAHGFDEFYGILYHLNAGEYVEEYDFPKDPEVAKFFTQRGVIHSWSDGRVEDLGGFGRERQRTLDQEVLVESKRFIRDSVAAGKPFFVWHNTTRMHYRTNLRRDDGARR
jgi:arylsulfatase A-like enzyme